MIDTGRSLLTWVNEFGVQRRTRLVAAQCALHCDGHRTVYG
ncbi:hypothetical protein GFS60_06557 (plasmid) [Rhodococcus sp. WAY2]|nr:hypothetical protein GFS60_06557 [Rhodococcus sp. WAY2]